MHFSLSFQHRVVGQPEQRAKKKYLKNQFLFSPNNLLTSDFQFQFLPPPKIYISFPLQRTVHHDNGQQKHLVKDLFLMLAHLSGTIGLKHYTTLILLPLLKPPSRRTCLITISKLFFTALPIPSSDTVCVCMCVCVRARMSCVCVCG